MSAIFMSADHIFFYDTTLRDGSQTKGVDFSVTQKVQLCHAMDKINIDYIEAGWPGANPTDDAFFNNLPALNHAKIVAFGMTTKNALLVHEDLQLKRLVDTSVKTLCLVGKTHDYHVELALAIGLNDNINAIEASFGLGLKAGKEMIFDCEHFFDGYKSNPDYTIACLQAAIRAGASTLVLCDTNGGSMTHEIFSISQKMIQTFPNVTIGIHCHDDCGLAVANTLAAIDAGARHIQGTINGLGERCGNTNLITVIGNICLKKPYNELKSNIDDKKLKKIKDLSRTLDDVLNRAPVPNLPYVGANAFAHKGGLHVSAILKDPKTYEHIDPEIVGNQRIIPVSNQSGKSNILMRLAEINPDFKPDNDQLSLILETIKQRESEGYGYDSATASFYVKALTLCHQMPDYFEVDSFRATSDGTIAEAIVKLKINNQRIMNVAEGNGPVDALYNALIKDLGIYDKIISQITLDDYKVRIIGSGTSAKTRVLIDFKDNNNHRFSTVGVSDDIVNASFEAIIDAINYYLKINKINEG